MQINKKIVFSVILLLLVPAITTVYGQTAQELSADSQSVEKQQPGGLTIFNTTKFYSKENAIVVHNDYKVVLNTKDEAVIDIFEATPTIQVLVDRSLNKSKISKKQLHIVATKSLCRANHSRVVEKNNAPLLISMGNTPFGNNSFYISAVNAVAVVPSITNYKLRITNYAIQTAGSIYFAGEEIAFQYSKQLFHSKETIFISQFYSKTSRIRPPPAMCC